jgi:hypothetical protein
MPDAMGVPAMLAVPFPLSVMVSQSRELLILSDGYEDCRDSIHLPRERLTAERIEVVIRAFEKQGRLPRFGPLTTAHFVGMRLNPASSRGYEDMVELFWLRLLTRCGVQICSGTWQTSTNGKTAKVQVVATAGLAKFRGTGK